MHDTGPIERTIRSARTQPISRSFVALLLWLVATWVCAQDTANRTPSDSSQEGAAFPHSLRVLSYNIHHAEGVDGRLDLERIAKVIQSVKPDIVALQEVDSRVERSKSVDQPQELAKQTGMKVVFGGNIDLQGGKYGNAVLSRGDRTASENRLLPNIDQGEQRGVLDVRVRHDGQSLRILATHFDHRRDSRERLASIDMVNQMVAEKSTDDSEVPTLLIGDLNAEFASEVLDRARSRWKVSNAQRMPTIPVTKPERQIDFILCYPPERWQVHEVKVLDEATASDHRPILAELKFR